MQNSNDNSNSPSSTSSSSSSASATPPPPSPPLSSDKKSADENRLEQLEVKTIVYTNAFVNLDKHLENINILNRVLQYSKNKLETASIGHSFIFSNAIYQRIFNQMRYNAIQNFAPISKFHQLIYKKKDYQKELYIFIHCRPDNINKLKKVAVLFSNIKEYNDLFNNGEYTVDYLFIRDSLPAIDIFSNTILIKYNPKSKYRFINYRLLNTVPEVGIQPPPPATNVFNKYSSKSFDQIVTFSFKTRPRSIKVGGVWLSLISFNELLEFKEFLIKFVYPNESVLWSINEPTEVINSLFQTLIDEDYLVANYFPEIVEHYWFAVPLCRDYRSKDLIEFLIGGNEENNTNTNSNNKNKEDISENGDLNTTTRNQDLNLQQLTTKTAKLLSNFIYTSLAQLFINPIHNGLLTSLARCYNYSSGNHFYTRESKKITFTKLNIDHSKCF